MKKIFYVKLFVEAITQKIVCKYYAKGEITMEEIKEEKTKKPIYTVIYNKDDRLWHITKSGAKRVIAKRVTKTEALEKVKELCENNEMNYVVRKKDGKFQKK